MKSNLTVKNRSVFSIPNNQVIQITAGELRKQFEKEFNDRADALFEDIKRDISAQFLCTVLTVLEKEFEFGKDDLQCVKRGTECLFLAMKENGIFGKKFDTQTCIEHMKEKFGVDFDKNEAQP